MSEFQCEIKFCGMVKASKCRLQRSEGTKYKKRRQQINETFSFKGSNSLANSKSWQWIWTVPGKILYICRQRQTWAPLTHLEHSRSVPAQEWKLYSDGNEVPPMSEHAPWGKRHIINSKPERIGCLASELPCAWPGQVLQTHQSLNQQTLITPPSTPLNVVKTELCTSWDHLALLHSWKSHLFCALQNRPRLFEWNRNQNLDQSVRRQAQKRWFTHVNGTQPSCCAMPIGLTFYSSGTI